LRWEDPAMHVTSEDIAAVSDLVLDLCGILLDESKDYLIESRLTSLCEAHRCATFADLIMKARTNSDRALQNQIVDAITTHETLFFRDTTPFEALHHKVLPDLLNAKAKTEHPRRLRIWSAACSTGQEPYSLAMTLCELIPDIHHWDIAILATDISDAVIRHGNSGCYAPHEIERGLKTEHLQRFFEPVGEHWKIRDEVRSLVSFRKQNLLESFRGIGPFDIIFCRNVVIYFPVLTRRSVFQRIGEVLTPEGYLFVGSSETLNDLAQDFAPQHECRTVYYRPRRAAVGLAGERGT
jgi:chemotaxis protein methyltransferase CheR